MNKRIICSFLSITLLMLGVPVAIAQTQTMQSSGTSATSPDGKAMPDNTKNNQSPSNRNQTAEQQRNNSTDMDLTRRIRQSVTDDKNLSTYAHNVKIVTANGRVTLNGVVRTDDEKAEIASKAASVVGKEHVVNDIKVAPAR